ncbi:MAG: type II secretion system F family protein [Anaeromyxobacteraceae bacterium]
MQLDGMAMVVATGFVLSLGAALGMLYSIVGTAGGLARQRRRRLAPSPDLPELVEHEDAVAQLLAHGLSPLAKLAKPVGEGELHALRAALSQAGFRGPQAVQVFLASRVIAAVACLAAVLWANAVRLQPLPMLAAWVLGAAAAGLFLPNLWLHARVQDRRKAVSRGLPDALDLLVTCVEAGLGLDSAIQRVAGEIVLAHRLLAEELGLTFLEVKAGVPRTDAFRRLADRTGVQDLKTLAATLTQTDLFGTSVAVALRVQAEGMRVRRMQKAEERAAVLSVKMTIPLVVCFLPALLVVLTGPAIVNIAINFVMRPP